MNPDIEQILLAQAAREAEQAPELIPSMALGAGGGAAIGALLGSGVRGVNQLPNKAINALAARQGLTPAPPKFGARFKSGARVAGGLMGFILGGGLGAAAQQAAINEPSGSGALLAKIQAQGEINADDELALQSILRDAYSANGVLA